MTVSPFSTIRRQPFQDLYRRHPISTRMDDFHVSGILETWKRPVLQAWVCGNLHESRKRGDHTAHLDGVFEAVAVALSVRVIAHNVG